MKSKTFLIILISVLIVGSMLGVWLMSRQNAAPVVTQQQTQESTQKTTFINIVSPTKAVQPTLMPFDKVVTSVDANMVTVESKTGKILYPNEPAKYKIYIRKNNVKTIASFSDLKVGQNITIENMVPGKSGDIIIEQ